VSDRPTRQQLRRHARRLRHDGYQPMIVLNSREAGLAVRKTEDGVDLDLGTTCLRRPAGPPRRAALRAVPRQRSRATAWPRDAQRAHQKASNAAGLARILGGPASHHIMTKLPTG
jgi:hypothetical protein